MRQRRVWGPWRAAMLALMSGVIAAQTHKVAAPEKVVRAVGVYEWTGEQRKPTASRIVPVSIFIDGQLQDAGVYLPQPIPFALVPGNEYELQRAGVPQALFALDYARHVQTAELGDVDGWFGYGSYKPEAVKKAAPALRASRTPGVITSSASGRPTLTRKTDGDTQASGGGTSAKSGDGSAADPDRPTMRRRSDSAPTDSSTAGTSPSNNPADDPDRPTLRRRTTETAKKDKHNDDVASVTGVGSLNADPDRPKLQRGRPAAAVGDEETEPPKIVGTPADLHQEAAVSDAATRPEHDFARAWTDDAERVSLLGKMQAMARAQLAGYPAAGSGASAPAKTGSSTTTALGSSTGAARSRVAARSRAAKAAAAPVALLDEQLRGYTLSYGGAATYVYTAHTAGTGADLRYVTVVAQAEVTGDLKAAMSSVTDAAHLDRTPWMRFVDVVDAEASNRASLLFELRGQSGRQFALYRVLGDRAEQLMATGTTP